MKVDGSRLTVPIYFRMELGLSEWTKEFTSLEDFLHRPFLKEKASVFALYRAGLALDANHRSKMDFVNHDVRVVISELDRKTDDLVNPSIRSLDWRENAYGPELFKEHREYAMSLMRNIMQDNKFLFCYRTTTGLGLRFGGYSSKRLDSQSYGDWYVWLAERALKFDYKNQYKIDLCGFTGDCPWFAPYYPDDVWVNKNAYSLRSNMLL